MKKVLIFGASGFVGYYLANEFLESNYQVYGTDVVKNERLAQDVEFVSGDLLDFDFVNRLIKQIMPSIIVNLAAISSVGVSWNIPQATVSVNVIGALNILESIKEVNPECKILFVGSSEEYDTSSIPINEKCLLNASNPYGISKVTQESFSELYKKHYGLKIYNVRSFNHTGIGQRDSFVLPSFCKQVAEIEKSKKSGTIKVGNLSAKRDFSSVKDIVRAYRMILESEDCSVVFNVGSGLAYGIDELLNFIIGLSSQKINIEIDQSRFRPIDQPIICCDNSLITNRIGWKPRYTIFDVLKEMFDEFIRS